MELSEVMRSSGAVRAFRGDPVPDEVLYAVLDDARFAPSGGNLQGWHVIVVRDPVVRRELADLSSLAWTRYLTEQAAGFRGFGVVERAPADLEVSGDLAPHPMLSRIEDVPEVLVVTVDLRVLAVMDRDLDRPSIVGGGSIYPFVQNILLAARNQGLGGVLTTFLAAHEPRVAALLGLGPEQAIAAMVGLGTPVHQVTQLRRRPVEAFATIDTFAGEAFTGRS
jgi:nitroreductase